MIKSFYNISDISRQDLLNIILDDNSIKNQYNDILKNKNIGFIFEKYSTRTRLSFAAGIAQLGGNIIDIKFEELNISRDESFEDTFKAMNCYLDGLIYRTSNHKKLIKASKYFDKPIINALSDISHPCQILADLYTIFTKFKTLSVNLLWMGDMNNVCFSLVEAANLINELKLTICAPQQIINQKNWKFNSNITVLEDLGEVNLSKVNCVMTDVFISMNDENNDEKIATLKPYTVNNELMQKTSSNSVFMHCLPAKVGLEVSKDVFYSSKSIIWTQAYNRLVAQKKLLHFIYQK